MLRIFATLALLITGSLFAQPLRELTRLKADLPLNADAYAFTNERGTLLLFQEGQQAHVFQLTPNLRILQQFKVLDLPEPSAYERLGFTYRDGNLYICYREKQTGLLQVVQVVQESESTEVFRVEEELAGDLQWGTFTHGGILHIIRVPRFGDEIRLCRFEGRGEFSTTNYQVPAGFTERLAAGVQRIDSSNVGQIAATYLHNKMYLQRDQLYLTLEDPGMTQVFHIDLTDQTQYLYEYPLPPSTLGSNSLLVDDHLLQLALTPDSLYFQVSPVGEGLLPFLYGYSHEEPLPLQNGPAAMMSPAGLEYHDMAAADIAAEWQDASHLALALEEGDIEHLILTCAGVWPEQERGISGAVIQEDIRSLAFQGYLSPFDFHPISAPTTLMATKSFPPNSLQRAPLLVTFSQGGESYWGYYDRQDGSFVLGR